MAAEPPVTAVAFALQTNEVIVGTQAGLTLWSWPQLERQRSIKTDVVNIHDLAFSPNGKLLVVAGGTPGVTGALEILSWPAGQSLMHSQLHSDSILSVAWQNDERLATGSLDHSITIWDWQAEQATMTLRGHSRGVSTVCFLSGQTVLVSGGLDQNLRVWDLEKSELLRSLNNHTRPIHRIAQRPQTDGLPMVASVSGDRTMRLWQPTIGRMVRFAQLDSVVLDVTWLPDGSRIAVATADGHVLVVDPDSVEVVEDHAAVDGWAYVIAAHPENGDLLVGGRSGQLKRIMRLAKPQSAP